MALKGVRPYAVLMNKMEEQYKLETLDATTKRIIRIWERKHLVEKFSISPANKEAYLANCQRFEDAKWMSENYLPKYYWQDWYNMAPVRQFQEKA